MEKAKMVYNKPLGDIRIYIYRERERKRERDHSGLAAQCAFFTKLCPFQFMLSPLATSA